MIAKPLRFYKVHVCFYNFATVLFLLKSA